MLLLDQLSQFLHDLPFFESADAWPRRGKEVEEDLPAELIMKLMGYLRLIRIFFLEFFEDNGENPHFLCLI